MREGLWISQLGDSWSIRRNLNRNSPSRGPRARPRKRGKKTPHPRNEKKPRLVAARVWVVKELLDKSCVSCRLCVYETSRGKGLTIPSFSIGRHRMVALELGSTRPRCCVRHAHRTERMRRRRREFPLGWVLFLSSASSSSLIQFRHSFLRLITAVLVLSLCVCVCVCHFDLPLSLLYMCAYMCCFCWCC
ncbi:hypothetical protein B0T26DRAFT_729844 [Lasiosphaeria miniovina]|uniref:Uncharacterized protein n=1 Tax=Lasiosphaeria miniovina TaxID=1954250 RepID=A0AA39ZT51_9PEZI|nr:uncharacterized protein B0T26DRAFT_729844 [Lasiosphaeria miniovina]KAK0703110.1 hypothetical protein B0T26DRAFT_729844 [Lasiosphaeria miniovina]